MNYGKRRLLILTKEQLKEGYIKSKHTPDRRLKVKYKVKEWKKFGINEQMYLTKIYHVILTDHMTRKERLQRIAKGFTPENIRKYSNLVSKNIDEFSKAMDQLSFGGSKSNKNFLDFSHGQKTDYSFLGTNDKKKNNFLRLRD